MIMGKLRFIQAIVGIALQLERKIWKLTNGSDVTMPACEDASQEWSKGKVQAPAGACRKEVLVYEAWWNSAECAFISCRWP
jgi:hypothetical protein